MHIFFMIWSFIHGFTAGAVLIAGCGLGAIAYLGRRIAETTETSATGCLPTEDAPFFDPSNRYEGHDYHQV